MRPNTPGCASWCRGSSRRGRWRRSRRSSPSRPATSSRAAAEKDTGDFVDDIAMSLPLLAIADLIGVPEADREKLFHWTNSIMNTDDPDFETDYAAANAELMGYAYTMAEERRRCPADDIVTRLVQADVDGESMDDVEFAFFVILLAVAGNETTRNAMTHGMNAFFDNPEPVGAVQARATRHRRRRDRPLGDSGALLPAHRAGGHRARRRDHPRGPARRPVLQLGQLRRRGLRPAVRVQHPARPQPAPRLRRQRRALLHRRQPGPHGDQADLQRDRRPDSRTSRNWRSRNGFGRDGSTASSDSRSPTRASSSIPACAPTAGPARHPPATTRPSRASSTRRARRSTPAAPTSPSPTSPARSASPARRSTGTSPAPTRCSWRPPCTRPSDFLDRLAAHLQGITDPVEAVTEAIATALEWLPEGQAHRPADRCPAGRTRTSSR